MGWPLFPRRTFAAVTLCFALVAVACEEDSQLAQVAVPEIQVDELTQRPAALVDILWVVDNSPSMVEEQRALAENFDRFIRGLTQCQGTGVDNDVCDFESKQCSVSGGACNPPEYHIGVVSTDVQAATDQGRLRQVGLCVPTAGASPSDGRFRYCGGSNADCVHDPADPNSSPDNSVCDFDQSLRFVTPTTANAPGAFSRLVQVGADAAAFETGIKAAARAVGRDIDRSTGDPIPAPVENEGFLRAEASLFVIFVSDEDDNSDGRITYFYRVFETLKGAGNEGLVSLSAIVGPPDIDGDGPAEQGCIPDGGTARNEGGLRYVALSMYTRGLAVDFRVCDNTARLPCPAAQTCEASVPGLPGVCVPAAACTEARDCGNLDCGGTDCISCVNGACRPQPEQFLTLLERNGVFASICAEYDEVLDSLGFEAAGLARKFELTRFPNCSAEPVPCCADSVPVDSCDDTAPICVKVAGEVIPNDRTSGWIFEDTANAIFFDGSRIPPTGADVTLSYRIATIDTPVGCATNVQ